MSSRGKLLFGNRLGRARLDALLNGHPRLALATRSQHWRLAFRATGTDAFVLVARPTASGVVQARTCARAWALTTRELGVLERLVLGESNKLIASELGCSERTVEVHVSRLLSKSACASRAVLIATVLSSNRG